MTTPVNIAEDFKKFCSQMDFDSDLDSYQDQLIEWQKLDQFLVLRNQFFIICDYKKKLNVYVHENVNGITGYERDLFFDFGFVLSLIHSEDRESVYEFSKRSISLARDYNNSLLNDPFFVIFSVDFRFKCKNGNYIKLNKQNCCFKTDDKGNMVYAFIHFTDISHIKKNDNVRFSWFGNPDYKLYFGDLIQKHQQHFKLTKREKDVLSMLSEGESATQIARRLSVSVHTIISHRKNLLHKTGAKNTAQLIKMAIEKAIILS